MMSSSFSALINDLTDVDFEQLVEELLLEVPVLTDKVKNGAKVDADEAKLLLIEVLRFLFLIGSSNQKLTPSHIVDMAWHEFILCTRLYHAFCDKYFKRFIHHHPGGKKESNHQQFQLTHKIYRELIGVPPERFWGKDPNKEMQSDCGACEAI